MGNVILPYPNPTADLYPAIERDNIILVKSLAGVTCVASIIGAIYVIFSFLDCCKCLCLHEDEKSEPSWCDICCCGGDENSGTCCNCVGLLLLCCADERDEYIKREKVKLPTFHYFLVCLSVADIGVAVAHLWGIFQNLEAKYIPAYHNSTVTPWNRSNPYGTDTECSTQAAMNIFFTLSSFLWTMALSCFLSSSVLCEPYSRKKVVNDCITCCPCFRYKRILEDKNLKGTQCCESPFWMYFFWPFICWGLPLFLVFGMAVHQRLGFTANIDTGWCYLYASNNESSVVVSIFTYILWVWIPLLISLTGNIIYCTVVTGRKKKWKFCCMKNYDENTKYQSGHDYWRYVIISLALILMRLPNSLIVEAILAHEDEYKKEYVAIFNIFDAVLESAQGLVDAIIIFTVKLGVTIWTKHTKKKNKGDESEPLCRNPYQASIQNLNTI